MVPRGAILGLADDRDVLCKIGDIIIGRRVVARARWLAGSLRELPTPLGLFPSLVEREALLRSGRCAGAHDAQNSLMLEPAKLSSRLSLKGSNLVRKVHAERADGASLDR